MAAAKEKVIRIAQGPYGTAGAMAQLFFHATTEAAATVAAAGYFNDCRHKVKVDDVIWVAYGIGGSNGLKAFSFATVPGSGDITTAEVEPITGGGAARTDVVDSTGGTPDSSDPYTLAAVTNPTLSDWDGASVYPSAAQATAINAAITGLKNAVATLAQEQNVIKARLRSAGIIAT